MSTRSAVAPEPRAARYGPRRRIVIWRHGQTEWNAVGRFQGQTDVPLDDAGREQAARAAALLASLCPDLIVSSDLSRAWDTAAALARIVQLDVQKDERLRETDAGHWQGLTAAEILQRFPEQDAAWVAGDLEVRPGGGENRREIAARMVAAIEDAAASLEPGGLGVIVTHGGASKLGVCTLIGLPLERAGNISGLSNCCWSMLREGPAGWVLVEHNAGTLPEPVRLEEG